jgi:hypothetical protein
VEFCQKRELAVVKVIDFGTLAGTSFAKICNSRKLGYIVLTPNVMRLLIMAALDSWGGILLPQPSAPSIKSLFSIAGIILNKQMLNTSLVIET